MNTIEGFSLLAAAFVASMFGQGGGILYTPLLVWNGVDFNTAASTSLFLILVTSLSATIIFRKAGKVDWGMALVMEVPTTLGAFLGGYLSHFLTEQVLSLLLSILLGITAWFMLRPPKEKTPGQKDASASRWIWRRTTDGESYQLDLRILPPVMLTVGVLTSMVGIGGGVIKVPLMVLLFGIPIPIAIGSSAFMVGLTASAGLLGHISGGIFDWRTALILAIPVFIGGQIGSRISTRIDARRLSRWYGAFILLVACITAFHSFLLF